PQIVGQAGVVAGRVEVLFGVRGHGQQRGVEVGRGGAALDVRPVVVLHHDEEHCLDGVAPAWCRGQRRAGSRGRVGRMLVAVVVAVPARVGVLVGGTGVVVGVLVDGTGVL